MKFFQFCALSLFAASVSCGGERAAVSTGTSESRSGRVESAAPVRSDQIAKKSGGGGGGSEVTSLSVGPNATLAQTQNSQIDTAPTDRKIVRNADLTLESDSPEESQKSVASIAESKGGFVVESQQSSSDKTGTTRDIVTMTVRVPAAKFAETVDEIRKTGKRVIIETIKGDDVTEEFIDVEARLRAQKATEQQFMDIMKRANSVEDALNVQRQLGEVRGEIEKIEGRKRFLENQSSLSTIKVRLQTRAAFTASSTGFFDRLGESFSTGLDFALSFVLALVTIFVSLVPFLILIAVPLFFVIRYVRKKRRQGSANDGSADDDQN